MSGETEGLATWTAHLMDVTSKIAARQVVEKGALPDKLQFHSLEPLIRRMAHQWLEKRETASPDEQYGPLALLFASLQQQCGVTFDEEHWLQAIRNVKQVREGLSSIYGRDLQGVVPIPSATDLFNEDLSNALLVGGLAREAWNSTEEDKKAARVMAIQWVAHLLLVHARRKWDGLAEDEKAKVGDYAGLVSLAKMIAAVDLGKEPS